MAHFAYDPGDKLVVVAAVPVSGYGPDTMIEVDYTEDGADITVGADGETVIVFNKNQSGSITLTLLQTTPSNALLQAVSAAFYSKKTLVPFAMHDNGGLDTWEADQSFCTRRAPKGSYGKSVGTNTWVFKTGKLVGVLGGSLPL